MKLSNEHLVSVFLQVSTPRTSFRRFILTKTKSEELGSIKKTAHKYQLSFVRGRSNLLGNCSPSWVANEQWVFWMRGANLLWRWVVLSVRQGRQPERSLQTSARLCSQVSGNIFRRPPDDSHLFWNWNILSLFAFFLLFLLFKAYTTKCLVSGFTSTASLGNFTTAKTVFKSPELLVAVSCDSQFVRRTPRTLACDCFAGDQSKKKLASEKWLTRILSFGGKAVLEKKTVSHHT